MTAPPAPAPTRERPRRLAATALTLIALLGFGALGAWRLATRPRLPAAERGRRLARELGCFTCHGPDGAGGHVNHGRADGTVPNFRDDVMMYAGGRDEIAEWIRDGVPRRRAAGATWQRESKAGAITMPAFGDRLTARQIDDLVTFIEVMSSPGIPDDGPARQGYDRAKDLGCFGCHGPGGRLAPENAGSFKGYVPSWDSADFADVVRDRAEFDEWVGDGVSRRFARNPAARRFLTRATVAMPAFRDHLQPGDLDAMWAWVQWMRSRPAGG